MEITSEHILTNVVAVESSAPAKESAKTKIRRFRAKVSHVDVVNGNGRLYPWEVFGAAITELDEKIDGKSKLARGFLSGAVDHASWLKGNLSESPIIWRSLKIEADGAVNAEFDLLCEHSKGRDLEIQIDGGLAIGFSTSSRCEFHDATDDDVKKYRLKYNPDGMPVRICDSMHLVKIDAVDDPSEYTARLLASHESRQKPQGERKGNPDNEGIADSILDYNARAREAEQFDDLPEVLREYNRRRMPG